MSLNPALRRYAPFVSATGLAAVLLGLPLAVDYKTTLETIHRATSGGSRSSDGHVEIAAVPLAPALGIEVQSARIATLGASSAPHDDRMRRLVLDGARVVVDLVNPTPARETTADPQAPRTVAARLAAMDYDTLLVRGGDVDIATGLGRRILLHDVSAEIASSRKGHWTIEGSGRFNGHSVTFSGRWSPQVERAGVRLVPLAFQLQSNLLKARFEGHLSTAEGPRLQGSGSLQARKLRALARWFGIPIAPSGDLVGGSVVGAVDWSKAALSFTAADIQLDGNEATGSVTLKTAGPRPMIEGTLGFRQFVLARYIPAVMGEADSRAMTPGPGHTKLVSLLAALDADLRLSAGKVVAPLIETGRAAMTVGVRNGKLQADLAELEIEGGQARGRFTIDATGETPSLAFRGTLADVDAGRVFSHQLKRTPLYGRADIGLDIAGTGATLPIMLAAMSGKGQFTLAQGGRLGLDLKTLVSASQAAQIVGWSAAGRGATTLDRLEGRFTIANGAVSLDAVTGRSGTSGWTASGKIDVAERLLDLAIVLMPGLAPEPPATIREGLAIRGTWSDPAISFMRVPMAPAASVGAGPLTPSSPAQLLRN